MASRCLEAVLSWIRSSLPFLGMITGVTVLAFNTIVSKVAMSSGTSFFILSVYSNALATLVLFPCGFLFHRSKRPPLTFPILCRIFLLAVFGCLADIGSYAGIKKTSPTLANELLNLVPGFTYILAVIFRFNAQMEGLNLKRPSDISKSLGTIVSIAGASIVTFYKGPEILNKMLTSAPSEYGSSSQQNWILGGFLLSIAALSTAMWSIVQTWILKVYPAEMIVVAFYCLFVTMQSTVVALIAEKNMTAWKLQAQMGLVAVLYAGIMNISLRLYVMSWCLWRTGPLFVSLFYPLTIVISVVIGILFLHEVLYFGSVAGAAVLVIGFYAVMWGRAEESKARKGNQDSNVGSTDHEVPLLRDSIEQA